MLDLNDFHYYVEVVERGGITAASKSLLASKSTISNRIRQLECALGVRLINRTSRQFSVTDVGTDFYKQAVLMLRQAKAAETIVRSRVVAPRGTIRMTSPVAAAQFAIGKLLPAFLGRFPEVDVWQHLTDRSVDIVAENFDLAIRSHSEPLPDSSLVQRTLGTASWRLFAARSYMEEYGTPCKPDHLSEHNTLVAMSCAESVGWNLQSDDGFKQSVSVNPRLISEDILSLKSAAEAGLGIVALPAYVCKGAIESGELINVLPEWSAGESTLTALVPVRQGMLPSVRAFMDFLVEKMPKVLAL
ncbi:LysR family transcriptional regulator [Paraburkholderia sp. LEh10]|uniref:LysR substrate-binding domain-containing protein n=1 Tax=Paraburkholderia sp. LEh10 TaxID=2821353 RepID=UPI001AE65BAA|nr:LysR substrate-binding domain-containing protein [Paraburkholderia sp. LEh10]MBP0589405.1 LysR family transcriptional regulator [Paraburkholderia sp. LEh10]